MNALKEAFAELVKKYPGNVPAEKFWAEIEAAYAAKGRYYHTLAHLENLLAELEHVRASVKDWDAALFALYYHDIVYKATKPDNEAQSAELAKERLGWMKAPAETIASCTAHILATKNHMRSADEDTNLFTDADLSILGQDRETYQTYCANVRKEYAIYPDLVYKPGRKGVLKHFLAMERIFKTEHFFNRYEKQARSNIEDELSTL